MRLTRTAGLMAAAALTIATLTACGAASPLDKNNGGDTTCADYLEMTPDEQRNVVTSYLDEKNNSNPAGYEVTLTLESSKMFCNTLGTADDPIRKIETG